MYQIARKTFLARNLKRLQKLYPMEFNFFPKTWCLPNEINDLRYAQEQAANRYERQQNKLNQTATNMNNRKAAIQKTKQPRVGFTMIVKPDCLSQGKGIFLTHDIDSIPLHESSVVQEYIPKPLLIDNLKFDMRIYVLVLSCDPLKIFVHKEGLVRFATSDYVPIELNAGRSALKDMFVHLTNYALNKDSTDFKLPTDINDNTSHKRSISRVNKTLSEMGKDVEKMWAEINDLIVKTILTVQPDLSHSYRTCQPSDTESLMCYELLGFDVMLNHDMKPILLEVNHAPSFATDSPLDMDIKHQLFVDMFRLLGLTIERKKEKLQGIYDEKVNRMLTKVTLKERTKMKKAQMDEFNKAQEKLEQDACGGFEKIFPLNTEGAKEAFEKQKSEEPPTPDFQLA